MDRLHGIIPCLLAALIAGGHLTEPCFAYEDEGFQFWTSVGASLDINKDWKCTFEEEFRLGDDGGHFYYHHSDLGFTYKGLADWLDLGFNYRQVYEEDSAGEWRVEHRPHLNLTVKSRIFDLDVSNRARIEYRDREVKQDVWRYRHKVTVKLPFELTNLKLKPYVADEFFITLNDDNVDRNRVYSGASFALAKNIEANIYYLWQASRTTTEWQGINVLGTQLRIRF